MRGPSKRLELGAVPRGDGTVSFAVWAPAAARVAVRIAARDHELAARDEGMFEGRLAAEAGSEYSYVLDGDRVVADPCSRSQPAGFDGASQILDVGGFGWSDSAFGGLALDDLILYELHVGTFTEAGTFDAAIERLAGLRELGVTAIELMPVGTFPGDRNWGYDGVYPSAPHAAYGGPAGLARLVDAAHEAELGVILDVVYNHVGPGIDLRAFGPYYTARHVTAWGDALDFGRAGVREWAIQNAELWVRDYHVDGLRLDAAHAVFDDSEPHVLRELADRVHAIDARTLVIAEMQTGDLRPLVEWRHDAQWADELHHVLHVLTTGERDGYYAPFRPSTVDLGTQLERKPPQRLVVCSQNHDQVGNRAYGDRPARDQLRLRAAALLFAPQTPLLFMGEEYGEQRPFQFFTDHRDPAIAEATRAGRRREFERFATFASGDLPDPQDPETFLRSKLARQDADEDLRAFYRELIALRAGLPPEVDVAADDELGVLRVRRGDWELLLNFSDAAFDGVPARDVRLRRT